MPDPEVCVCCWVDFRLPGMLADEKMRRENGFVKRCFTDLYPDGFTALRAMYHCSASYLQEMIWKTDGNIVSQK